MEITEELYKKAIVPVTLEEYEALIDSAKLIEENKALKAENEGLKGKVSWLEYDLTEARSLLVSKSAQIESLRRDNEELQRKLDACESK